SDPLGGEAEWPRIGIAGLRLALGEVDGPAIEPARRSRLKASQLETARRQAVAERFSRLISCPAAARLGLAGVHEGFEERAGRQNNGGRSVERVAACQHSGNAERGGRLLFALRAPRSARKHEAFDNL